MSRFELWQANWLVVQTKTEPHQSASQLLKWCQDRTFLDIILYILKQYKRRGQWLAWIKRDDLRPEKWEYVHVCFDHFVCVMPAKLYDSSNPDWAPSLKLGYNKTGTQAECSLGRYERAIQQNTTKRPALTDIGL